MNAPLVSLASGDGSKGERPAPLRQLASGIGSRGGSTLALRRQGERQQQPRNEEERAAPLRHGRTAAAMERERAAPLRHGPDGLPGQRGRLER